MREHVFSLVIPAILGAGLGVSLVWGEPTPHRLPTKAPAPVASTRTIKVQAYDADIPKLPLQAEKLEVMPVQPQMVAEALAAPIVRPQPQAPATQPPPARLLRVQDPTPRPPPPSRQRPTLDLRADPYGERDDGRFIESRRAGDYAPDDPRFDAPPEPAGFRITVPMCRRAERMGDPLADTGECQGMLRAAQMQARMCARAFEDGDDEVVFSPACRQAAMVRERR